MAIPILCVVGRSNSGKTTLIERLIPELVQAGYRVATVKHAGHGFDLDTEGKDSWRHKRAGASTVIVLSRGSLAMFSDVSEQIKVEEIRDRYLDHEIDLISRKAGRVMTIPRSSSCGISSARFRCPRKACWRSCPTSRWMCPCLVCTPTTCRR